MEKYFFINHIVFGKLYFHILLAVFIIIFLIFIRLLSRHKNNFHAIKEHFLTAVLVIWLCFASVLVSAEIKWLAADYPALINKSRLGKAGFFYKKFAGDDQLFPYIKFVKANIPSGTTAYFVSPSGFAYTFSRYYLYPDIKLINTGMPEYILLYQMEPARFNANRPLEIYKSFAPDKNILKIKI